MHIADLVSIYRYPVKALRGERLVQAEVREDGVAGDRAAALFVTAGHARAGKTYRGKEHALLHTLTGADEAVSAAASVGVTAVRDDALGRYFDAHPVSLILEEWLEPLAALTGSPVEALRFRPNLVARSAPGVTLREPDFVGIRLRIGSVELLGVASIIRCVTPSYDLETGERDATLAKAIAVDAGNVVGVYLTVSQPGSIAAGDRIEQI